MGGTEEIVDLVMQQKIPIGTRGLIVVVKMNIVLLYMPEL